MKTFEYPLYMKFHIATLSNDFSITDSSGKYIAYVRQKMLKLRERVEVFEDDSQSNKLYDIRTNQWLDFSLSYNFTNQQGEYLGKVARKGWASLWRARYHVFNNANQEAYIIKEGNGWVKVLDSFLGDIPILGMFTGYFFNPQYHIKDMQGNLVGIIKKEKSFFGRRFTLNKVKDVMIQDEENILLASMMMLLLERRRG